MCDTGLDRHPDSGVSVGVPESGRPGLAQAVLPVVE